MIPLRRWSPFFVLFLVGLMGCQPPTSPDQAPQQYTRLVQQAVAEAEAHPDTSFFWLRNTGHAQARSLMLDLGIDYLRYDRHADILCLWTGEGLWPARGYVTAPSTGSIPVDSIGALCNIEGDCTSETVTERWRRFRCE